MKINKAYKTELDPNDRQRTALLRHAGAARKAYNWGLEQKIKALDARKAALAAGVPKADVPKIPTYFDLHKQLVILKNVPVEQGGFPWMYKCSKSAPQEALRDLDKAFEAFYRNCKAKAKAKGFPQFKSRKESGIGGFRLDSPNKVSTKTIKLPKLGVIRVKEVGYLPVPGESIRILSSSVREKVGKWFVSLGVEQEIPDPVVNPSLPILGVDVGSRKLVVNSDGKVYENPKALLVKTHQLKRLQQSVSRKVKGSNNRRKAQDKVAKLHYRISCIRKDAIHKASDSITKSCSGLVLEDLNVKGMLRNHKLARTLADASMGELHRQLRYKAQWRGIPVLDAPRFYPSSKTCSHCGAIKADLGSSETYSCQSCGCVEDRDHNAAKNLAALWVKTTGSSPVAACGDFSPGCGRVSDISETGVCEARTEQQGMRERSQLVLVSENGLQSLSATRL
jgi:putative transposase